MLFTDPRSCHQSGYSVTSLSSLTKHIAQRYITDDVATHHASVQCRRKNIESSSKSNPLRRRQKNTMRRHEHGGVIVEKILKSRGTFNKNFCDLSTAIMYI